MCASHHNFKIRYWVPTGHKPNGNIPNVYFYMEINNLCIKSMDLKLYIMAGQLTLNKKPIRHEQIAISAYSVCEHTEPVLPTKVTDQTYYMEALSEQRFTEQIECNSPTLYPILCIQ